MTAVGEGPFLMEKLYRKFISFTTGERPSAMVVQELSQGLTYHGNLQGR